MAQTVTKTFTIHEANKALPYISRIMTDVNSAYARTSSCRARLGDNAEADREYEEAMDRLTEYVDELTVMGVELKDFERSLIEFPSVYHGHPIYLSWLPADTEIGYWRKDSEVSGTRHPLDSLQCLV